MRLLTRSDFDGLACATLLKELGVIDSWKFVHPKDMQDGVIEVGPDDVLANVPYVKGCRLWFDHHTSEKERLGTFQFEGVSRPADSAARVIYEYYDGATRAITRPIWRPNGPGSPLRKSKIRRAGFSSASSWIRAPASGVSATSAFPTTN